MSYCWPRVAHKACRLVNAKRPSEIALFPVLLLPRTLSSPEDTAEPEEKPQKRPTKVPHKRAQIGAQPGPKRQRPEKTQFRGKAGFFWSQPRRTAKTAHLRAKKNPFCLSRRFKIRAKKVPEISRKKNQGSKKYQIRAKKNTTPYIYMYIYV